MEKSEPGSIVLSEGGVRCFTSDEFLRLVSPPTEWFQGRAQTFIDCETTIYMVQRARELEFERPELWVFWSLAEKVRQVLRARPADDEDASGTALLLSARALELLGTDLLEVRDGRS